MTADLKKTPENLKAFDEINLLIRGLKACVLKGCWDQKMADLSAVLAAQEAGPPKEGQVNDNF